MDDIKGGKTASEKGKDEELSDEQAKRSVVISNIPTGTNHEHLTIHFQKTGNGGGEVELLKMLDDGKAILIFEETKVAASVLKKEHKLDNVVLDLKPYSKKEPVTAEKADIFSLVSAKIDPALFDKSCDEMDEVLSKISEETKIKYIQLCDGFFVSGAYKQIMAACVKLSALSTPIETRSNGVVRNDRDGSRENSQDVVLDVQTKLMQILKKDIQSLQHKYKMTIVHKADKVALRPRDGDWKSFETGKEEFITIYQKAFQEMDEKCFEMSTEDRNIQQLFQEIMGELDVVIELKNKTVSIYGKNEHVAQAMRRLQGKPRRSRRLHNPNNDILPKPDTGTSLPKSLKQQLNNGVTVSVYQGDITQQQVDVIVNAANEHLEHGGGVAGAIVNRGGYQIQMESRQIVQRYGPVPVGRVAYTGPGHIPCKKIFHAVGPQWKVHGPEGSRQLIFNACYQCFRMAAQFGFKSIVLPAISSGIFGVPKDICADVLFHSAEMFSSESNSQNPLKDIRFVNIDSETNEAFRKEFHRRYLESQATYGRQITPNDGVPAFLISPSDKSGMAFSTRKGNEYRAQGSANHLSPHEARNKQSYAAAASVKGEQQTRTNPLTDKNKTPLTRKNEGDRNDQVRSTNHPTPGKAAAAAALKREEQARLKATTDPLQQNISEGESSPSFIHGFKNRQTETSRDEADNQEERRDAKDANFATKGSVQNDKRKAVRSVQQKPNIPLDGDQQECSTGPKDQKPHEAKKSFKEDKVEKESQDSECKSSSPDDTCKEVRKKENEHPPSESRLSGAGRGRGALSHVPCIAANLSGRSEGVSPNQQLSTTAVNNKYSPSVNNLPEEAVSNVSGMSEMYVRDDQEPLQGKLTFSSTDGEPEKTLTQHASDRPPEKNHPPGLGVTKEGLNFAAKHNIEDVQKSSSSQQHESGENDACMKRKINDDPSVRSPKLRKQDVKESEENPDENQQNEDSEQDQEMRNSLGSTKQVDRETNAAAKGSQTGQPAETDSADNASGEKHDENVDMVQDDISFSESNSKDTIKTHAKLEQRGDLEEETDGKVTKEREPGNDEENKGNDISLAREEENPAESACCNDRNLANEQLQENSMQSFVVLEKEGLISKVNPIDEKIEGSCSDESIVMIETANDCTRNEHQSANATQSTISMSAKTNERSEQGSYEGSSVLQQSRAVQLAAPASESKEIMTGSNSVELKERTKETIPSLDDCHHENEEKSEETDSRKNESNVGPVDSLANLFQGLSTSDEKAAKNESPGERSNPSSTASEKECGLCMTAFSDDNSEFILSGCGHVICTRCIVKFQDQQSPICPTCEKKAGCNGLQPPNGTMTSGVMEQSLPGFGDSGTIYINYSFPCGIQGSCHPNPSCPYDPMTRRTFLPDTPEGQNVLDLLRKAFSAGLLFTVGRCTINSRENQVIFSDVVDHKFNLKGSESGYPDPNYLVRVVEKLQPLLENKSSPPLP